MQFARTGNPFLDWSLDRLCGRGTMMSSVRGRPGQKAAGLGNRTRKVAHPLKGRLGCSHATLVHVTSRRFRYCLISRT